MQSHNLKLGNAIPQPHSDSSEKVLQCQNNPHNTFKQADAEQTAGKYKQNDEWEI